MIRTLGYAILAITGIASLVWYFLGILGGNSLLRMLPFLFYGVATSVFLGTRR